MANISQKISSYISGISQQPDHLKRPGQVRNLLNGLPDITEGLLKRPGSELISKLNTTPDGKWFTMFRDANEAYIAQINAGVLKIWSLIDGLPRVVRYNSTPDLENPEDGGVGLPPPQDDEPSSPGGGGGSGGGSTLPNTCNLDKLTETLDSWIAAKEDESKKRLAYEQALETYNTRKADPKREEYRAPTHSSAHAVRCHTHRYLGVVGSLPSNHLRMAEDRGHHGMFSWGGTDHWSAPCADGRGYYILAGSYTDAEIQDAKNKSDAAYAALEIAEATTGFKRTDYENESAKCNVQPHSRSRALTPGQLSLDIVVPYLANAASSDISTVTLNDYTFVINNKVTVTMGTDKSTARPHEAFLTIKALEYNTEYNLTLTKPGAPANVVKTYAKSLVVSPSEFRDGDGNCPLTKTQTFDRSDGAKLNLRYQLETRGYPIANGNYDYDCQYNTYITLINGGEGWITGDTWTVNMGGKDYTVRVDSHGLKYTYDAVVPISPYLSPKDQATGLIKPEAILQHFKSEIEKVSGWSAQIIGNGLYIKGKEEFSAYTSGGRAESAIEIFTNKVNNISKLPLQCKDGYIVKILNTGEFEDDYYVRFIGTKEGVDGAGAWEETVAPNIPINLNYTTMPHQIVRMPDGTFMLSPVEWENRLVGDKLTNPAPSFVGKQINKMFFYRNRLGVLSDENVILSKAGDFFNFFVKTAITVSDSDPIDLAASSTTPCVLHDAVPMVPGLVLFSRDKQFILSTSQDLLSPNTAKIDILSTYSCREDLEAFEMGSTIGFVGPAGKYARMWEMTNLQLGTSPEIIEQSKIVQELLSSNINTIADSKDNTLVVFGIKGTKDATVYRYFNDGQKRVQSAWFQWSYPGDLVHHAVDKDVYYSVLNTDGELNLTKTVLTARSSFDVVTASPSYAPCLDIRTAVPTGAISYDKDTRSSSFLVKYKYGANAVVFGIGQGENQGRVEYPTIKQEGDKWRVTVPGNWQDELVSLGYLYTMNVELPHNYYTKDDTDKSVTDTRMYTNIHRVKFAFGRVGYFDIVVKRKGKEDTRSTYEQSPANDYSANRHEVLGDVIHIVSVYEKNTNTNILLTSTHPTPCTLLSSVWEGAASPKSYKSV
jgi:hypothetical protein